VKKIERQGKLYLTDIFSAYGGIGRGGFFSAYRWKVFPHSVVSKFIPDKGVVYDIGCGYGIFSIYLAHEKPGRQVKGFDFSSLRLSSARRAVKNLRLSNCVFFKEDVLKTKLEQCAGVVINDVLHHIPGWYLQKRLIEKVIKPIEPGGRLIIVDIDQQPRWKYYLGLVVDLTFYPGSCIAYPDKNRLRKFLENNGFYVKILPLHQGRPYASIMYVAEKQK